MPVIAPERPAGALFRALRNANVEAESAYEAVEEVRDMAGRNVVAELGARIDASAARSERSETELGARIDALGARIDSLAARIDTLQKVLWPLVIAISAALLSAVGGDLFALLKG